MRVDHHEQGLAFQLRGFQFKLYIRLEKKLSHLRIFVQKNGIDRSQTFSLLNVFLNKPYFVSLEVRFFPKYFRVLLLEY